MKDLTALIKKYFPQEQWANAMKVAQGESSYGVNLENNNTDGSRDLGPFQINSIHAADIKRIFGYNFDDLKNDFEKNVQVAKWLYDREKGWTPWVYANNNGISGYTPSPTNIKPLPSSNEPQTSETPVDGLQEGPATWQVGRIDQKTPGRAKFEAGFKKYNETPKKATTIWDILNVLFSSATPKAYASGNGGIASGPNQNYSPARQSNQYFVKPGDTLWDIAQQNLGSGSRWKELQGYTGDPRQLPIGTQLTMPKPIQQPQVKPVTIPQSITGTRPTFETNRWLTNPIFQTPKSTYTPRFTA